MTRKDAIDSFRQNLLIAIKRFIKEKKPISKQALAKQLSIPVSTFYKRWQRLTDTGFESHIGLYDSAVAKYGMVIKSSSGNDIVVKVEN